MPLGITPFTRAAISAKKNAIRDRRPDIKSSHVDEALAYGFGFDTYAAMLPVLEMAEARGIVSARVVPEWVMVRLSDFGYEAMSLRGLFGILMDTPNDVREEARLRNERTSKLYRPSPANDV